jgi:hypothetical protein
MRYTTHIPVIAVVASLVATVAIAQQAKPETQAELMRQAKVSKATATRTALAVVRGGKVRSSEIERENGKLIYSFDIKVAGKSGIEEVNVDAITGKVVAHEHETAKAEKKEATTEALEKKAPTTKK